MSFALESRSLHPDKEISTKFWQFWVKTTKSVFVIHGVTHSSLNDLKLGVCICKLNEVKSPRQQRNQSTCKCSRDCRMFLTTWSEITCEKKRKQLVMKEQDVSSVIWFCYGITWNIRITDPSWGQTSGITPSIWLSTDAPRPIVMAFRFLIAGFNILSWNKEKPHPNATSSRTHFLPNTHKRSSQWELLAFGMQLQLIFRKFLHDVAFKHLICGFLLIIKVNAWVETWIIASRKKISDLTPVKTVKLKINLISNTGILYG